MRKILWLGRNLYFAGAIYDAISLFFFRRITQKSPEYSKLSSLFHFFCRKKAQTFVRPQTPFAIHIIYKEMRVFLVGEVQYAGILSFFAHSIFFFFF